MKALTDEDKINAFIAAVTSFRNADMRWKERAKSGLNDEQLSKALRDELGIAGGCSGNEKRPSIAYQGAGLKIWASWEYPNHCLDQPILEASSTLKLARKVYQIPNPDDNQLCLF